MKIKTKIIILLTLAISCLLLLVIAGSIVDSKNDEQTKAADNRYFSYLIVNEFKSASANLTRLARTYAATSDASNYDEYFHIVDLIQGKVQRPSNVDKNLYPNETISMLDIMQKLGFSDTELNYLKESIGVSANLVKTETQAMESIKAREYVPGPFRMKDGESVKEFSLRILFDDNYHQEIKNIVKPMEQFFLALEKRTFERYENAKAEASFWMSVSFILEIIMIIMVVGLAWYIIAVLFKPLDHVVKTMSAIDMGDEGLNLTQELPEKGEIEIVSLSKGFNVFNQGIKSLLNKFDKTTNDLSTSASELSDIAGQTQSAIAVQKGALDSVATAVQQMVATVQDVASSAAVASEKAQSCESESKEGQTIVSGAVDNINLLKNEMNTVSSAISNVEDNSNTITTVLDVIRGIAEQTNLLALNAAIESARAGEQGRGFAVVADEVRSLAKRTQESTEEIQGMIQNLQENSKAAVSAMEISNKQAELCVDNTHKAGEALHAIGANIDEITGMNLQIATASEEQSTVIDEISRNIHEVLTEIEHTSTAADDTANSSGELTKLSQELQSLMSQFKL